jgi:hypothetical protein
MNTKQLREESRLSEMAKIEAACSNVAREDHGDLHIILYTDLANKPCMRVWRRSAAKPFIREYYNKPEHRQQKLESLKESDNARREAKAKFDAWEKARAQTAKAELKEGDILCQTGGATMSFVDFWMITTRKGCKLSVMPVGKIYVSGCHGQGCCIADGDSASPIRKDGKICTNGDVKIEGEHYRAHKWDGSSRHENHWD